MSFTKDCASFGNFTRFAVEANDTNDPKVFSDASERYGILAESFGRFQPFQGRRRITGRPALSANAIRPHSFSIRGAVSMQPGPADMSKWMPRALWGGNDFSLGTECPDFDVMIDREAVVLQYPCAIVTKQVFESATESGNEPTNEELIIMTNYMYAVDEIEATWPDPEPSLDLSADNTPYIHAEGSMTFDAKTMLFRTWRLTIDNLVVPLYWNSLGPSCFAVCPWSMTRCLRRLGAEVWSATIVTKTNGRKCLRAMR